MKKMIFILALMPAVAFGEIYTYSNVLSFEKGSDAFSFDQTACKYVKGGHIELTDRLLKIDNTTYKLRETKRPETYKAKGCTVKLEYKDNNLYKVQMLSYGREVNYYISKSKEEVAAK